MQRKKKEYGFVIKKKGQNKMEEFKKKEKVVIIGIGGIVGEQVEKKMIERGWENIVGIEKQGIKKDIGQKENEQDL